MFFLSIQKCRFKHDPFTRVKQNNIYLIPKCKTEFRKKKPGQCWNSYGNGIKCRYYSLFLVLKFIKKLTIILYIK